MSHLPPVSVTLAIAAAQEWRARRKQIAIYILTHRHTRGRTSIQRAMRRFSGDIDTSLPACQQRRAPLNDRLAGAHTALSGKGEKPVRPAGLRDLNLGHSRWGEASEEE